jgi:N-acetylneuraminic acid mutarotase
MLVMVCVACAAMFAHPAAASTPGWHIGRSLPEGRSGGVAVAGSRGTVYLLGGDAYEDGDAVYARDPVSHRWHVAMRLPSESHTGTAVMLNRRIYLIGGDAPGAPYTDRVLLLAPGRGTWTRGVPLPEPRILAHAVVVRGEIYVVGGFTPDGPARDIVRFDPDTQRWSHVTDLPTERYAYAVAKDRAGSIYLIGGVAPGAAYEDPPLDLVESYDTASGTWRTRAPLLERRYAMAATVTPTGKIVAAGGAAQRDPERSHSDYGEPDTYVYDPATDRWSVGPLLRAALIFHAMVSADSRVWVIGGATDSGEDECCNAVVQYLSVDDLTAE